MWPWRKKTKLSRSGLSCGGSKPVQSEPHNQLKSSGVLAVSVPPPPALQGQPSVGCMASELRSKQDSAETHPGMAQSLSSPEQ